MLKINDIIAGMGLFLFLAACTYLLLKYSTKD